MKSTLRLLISLLLICAVPAASAASTQATLAQQLVRCASLDNDQQRLACYDALAHSASSGGQLAKHLEIIQPPAAFLKSRLVAEPWKEEYHLTIRGFVDLISHAKLESGKRVTVQGWSRDKHDYVLHITMDNPVQLHFLPRDIKGNSTPMSLLREVTMDGYTMGAGQFIMVIAAMVPD